MDSLELQIRAAWCGQIFARTERLSERTLQSLMPKRGKPAKANVKSDVAMWDAWARGVSKRFERVDKQKAEQLKRQAEKKAAKKPDGQ